MSCHERALRLLSLRPRSTSELRSRLLRAGFEREEVDDVLVRLESVGLLDDDRFAHDVVEHAVTVRRAGRRGIVGSLRTKGIDPDAIERAIGDLGDDEARAGELARARARRLGGLSPETAHRRLVSLLVRRGYDSAVARRVAREVLGLDPAAG